MEEKILNEINKKLDLLIERQGKECNCELKSRREEYNWWCPIHGTMLIKANKPIHINRYKGG